MVAQKGRDGVRNRLRGVTLEKEKSYVFGIIQRCGVVVIQMLTNVRGVTIESLIKSVVLPGTFILTDEYEIHNRLIEWGDKRKSVNHEAGEYARNEDGDDFHEVRVNTMENFRSLLCGWLRLHRDIS
ncbi:transposase [uncultured Desulfobacter sp.]|uniref:transposase n=1 Tax=uncultured Desulfobacter sp. TaxID=240139 RepID=UPI0029F5C84A|nr:transposase [uncultured Desulfobacter sp.]